MTPAQEAHNQVVLWIDSCHSSFHFKAAERLIDLFSELFPNEKEMKKMLIDLCSDKHQEIFKNGKH